MGNSLAAASSEQMESALSSPSWRKERKIGYCGHKTLSTANICLSVFFGIVSRA